MSSLGRDDNRDLAPPQISCWIFAKSSFAKSWVPCFPSWGFMFSLTGFHVFPRRVSCFPCVRSCSGAGMVKNRCKRKTLIFGFTSSTNSELTFLLLSFCRSADHIGMSTSSRRYGSGVRFPPQSANPLATWKRPSIGAHRGPAMANRPSRQLRAC